MTFKITQYSWFLWHDQDGNTLFDDRDILFSATADGNETPTTVTLHGTAYDIVVTGVDLAVDNGQLSGGTGHTISVFDAATDTLLVVFSGMNLDIAGFLYDYENDVTYPDNPNASGFIFDASRVAAQPNGGGIGFGTNSGDDTMFGSAGSDELAGFAGNDRILGNAGNDGLWGSEGNDTLLGGAGNDDLFGFTGNDSLKGGAGNDYLSGWIGKDTLDGGLGYDNLYGGAGNDSLLGGKGNDFLSGDGGKDTLDGGAGRDWAAAYVDDNDTNGVTIDLAQQTMTSVYGTDKLISIESAYGGNGEDTLRGSDGSNNIAGLGGRDALFGAGGNDRIWSGLGKDTTTGGAGDDAFVFFEWGKPYADRVTDFVHGDDKIELAIGTFDALSMGTLKANNFVLGTNAKDSNDFLIYDKGTGKLYYDPDGNGDAGSGLIATFASRPTPTASDIKVVAFTTFNEFWV